MILATAKNDCYGNYPDYGYREDMSVAYESQMKSDLDYEAVSKALAYDPETGVFTWLISPAKNTKAGAVAGSFKGVRKNSKTGAYTRYMYIRFGGYEVTASRMAWLLFYGKFPKGNILFLDDDPANLRIANLKEARFKTNKFMKDGRARYQSSHEAQRHYGLKRYYGMTLAEYTDKAVAQNGVCAVCAKPERAVMHGKVKPLSVDHNHDTGIIRDLLCSTCNHMLGHCFEDRDILLEAVKYLDKHNGAANVIELETKE